MAHILIIRVFWKVTLIGSTSDLYLAYSRRYSSSDHLPICILLIKSWVWTIHYHSFVLGLLTLSAKAQYMIWVLNPTSTYQKWPLKKNYTIENCIIAIVITLIIAININHNSVVNNVASFGPFLSSCHMRALIKEFLDLSPSKGVRTRFPSLYGAPRRIHFFP